MTDRELLEMAAKAAGIEIINADFIEGPHYKGTTRRWNPLDDDGDALRLAAKLFLTVDIDDGNSEANSTWFQVIEKHDGDSYAATRRAIVRAASEIGRAMK